MYYEQAQDRVKELRCMNKAKTLFDELNDWNWIQRNSNLAGVIYDFEGESRNALLVPNAFADVKVLYDKTNYPNNIISVEKFNFMKQNPAQDFWFLGYYTEFRKFRLRPIKEQYSKLIKNFTFMHKRESKLQGRPVYKTQDVYFLTSPAKEKSIDAV
jgi:hypothetical protein